MAVLTVVHLVNRDPVLASLFGSGIRLRNPWFPGAVKQEYKGKLPPTFFHHLTVSST